MHEGPEVRVDAGCCCLYCNSILARTFECSVSAMSEELRSGRYRSAVGVSGCEGDSTTIWAPLRSSDCRRRRRPAASASDGVWTKARLEAVAFRFAPLWTKRWKTGGIVGGKAWDHCPPLGDAAIR